MVSLQRRLGTLGAIAIGVSAMLGAGVFYVWKPAWELAGSWIWLSLAIAAIVATLNGLVTTQLAIRLPVSGGIYAYGRHYRGPFTGFMAGWLFVTGKTGSAAAIAYVAASYLTDRYEKLLAVGFVVVLSAVIISGIRLAAGVSIGVSGVVILGLAWLALPSLAWQAPPLDSTEFSIYGVLGAAGLMFFAFAGYARMATLGEEVKRPSKTLPLAIIGALTIVLALYFAVGAALIPRIAEVGAVPEAPLTLLASPGGTTVLGVVALLASLGSLLAVLAGLSRTGLAMARNSDLPRVLAKVSTRTKGPVVAEISVACAAIVLIALTDPLTMVALSSTGVLLYYAIGHLSALAQSRSERILPAVIPVLGLILNLMLVSSLPWQSLVGGVAWATVGAIWFWLKSRLDPSATKIVPGEN